jgi:hypothetical protein
VSQSKEQTHSSHDYLQELGVKKAATKYSAADKLCPVPAEHSLHSHIINAHPDIISAA